MSRGENIRGLYLLSILAWLLLIAGLQLYPDTIAGWIFLAIPVVIFGIGIVNADQLCEKVEAVMFEADFLSIGLLVVLPLLTWVTKDYGGDRKQFLSIVVVAIILTLFSMLDVWVPYSQAYLVKHLKSVFQTASIALLIYALYMYYVNHSGNFRIPETSVK